MLPWKLVPYFLGISLHHKQPWQHGAGGCAALSGPWVMPLCVCPAGWVAGPIVLALFAWITYFCSALLIDAYRYPDVDGDTRNYKYSDAVSRYMGAMPIQFAQMIARRA